MVLICRHCGNSDPDKIAKMEGKSHRPGLYYCNECNGQFTVTVGTVFERSKVPLTKWWMAAHMLNQGKNGRSAHEIHRNIGVTYKTAWFMMHRLREAMTRLQPRSDGRRRPASASGRNLLRQHVEAVQVLSQGLEANKAALSRWSSPPKATSVPST